jgi:exopolyphosphatase / guanosine-5'-triphosphate,3'-diphosphate pyrophosphatase
MKKNKARSIVFKDIDAIRSLLMGYTYKKNLPENTVTVMSVDLGSNAMRAVIARKHGRELTILYNDRIPLRLGEDVFKHGQLSSKKINQTLEAFIQLLFRCVDFGVTDVRAFATSAMREAKNGKALIHEIQKVTGITIELISGLKEADLILSACQQVMKFEDRLAVLVDIGGGSTEITLIKNNKHLSSRSFPIGTVRLLQHTNREFLDQRLKTEVKEIVRYIKAHVNLKKIDDLVGTGGNLRRIGKIRKKIMGKPDIECQYSEITHMAQTLFSMTFIDRIRRLELDQDRADVILPAILLIERLMKELNLKKILLPKVGLKEGILLSMFDDKKLKFNFDESNPN